MVRITSDSMFTPTITVIGSSNHSGTISGNLACSKALDILTSLVEKACAIHLVAYAQSIT